MSEFETEDLPIGSIAIIGMSGRFPGAKTVREHWANVLGGRDCVSHFDDGELEDNFDRQTRDDEAFVKARSILDDVDRFDAGFFGYLAREAALIDPQQRIFLEIAWEAFEDAGYDPAKVDGPVGVFAGASMNTYLLKHVLAGRAAIEEFTSQFQIGDYLRLLGGGDFIATRTAYKLGLTGPAMAIQTACSTSLTAISQAVQALQLYQCDMALAGGASISFPQKRGYLYEEGGMGASDGVCRPFDAAATGTVFGSGAGVVLLKRLEDAVADGDQIYATIRGFGMNNDGGDKVGFTAPSVEGQANAIARRPRQRGGGAGLDRLHRGPRHRDAAGRPDRVRRPGPGLPDGRRGRRPVLRPRLGEGQLGHLDAAAGVTSLISAALALRDKTLPPLLHFTAPNPNIDLDSSPFFVNSQARPWTVSGQPRRAGVSSFGVGGTNVHVVLEEAPAVEVAPVAAVVQVLPLSARSESALRRMAGKVADHLEAFPDLSMADVATTLQSGRRAFEHRAFVTASDPADALAKLRKGAAEGQAQASPPPVVFMFPGQGSQYAGMGGQLYDSEPVYRDWIDRGAAVLAPHLGLDIRTLMRKEDQGDDAPHPIRDTVYAQPALFLVEYALAQLWMSRGIVPTAMIGHSIGELVAAALAGAVAFEDALALIARRGALMQAVEPGAMTAVRLPEAELRPLLPADLDIAALNAPALSVVAGPFDAMAAFEAVLAAQDVTHRRLHTSHAFHSRMMDGAVVELAAFAETLGFGRPTIPYVSSVTGEWASPEVPVSGAYWARHCRETVRFGDAMARVIEGEPPLLLEIGPGRALTTFAMQGLPKGAYRAAIPSLPEFSQREDELAHVAEAAGRLWINGADLDWSTLRAPGSRRISLPTYAFEPERHWVDAPAGADLASVPPTAPSQPAAEVPVSSSTSEKSETSSMSQSPSGRPRRRPFASPAWSPRLSRCWAICRAKRLTARTRMSHFGTWATTRCSWARSPSSFAAAMG